MIDPRPFDLNKTEDFARLMRELEGYMRVSLNNGTDIDGRRYAYEALKEWNLGVGLEK